MALSLAMFAWETAAGGSQNAAVLLRLGAGARGLVLDGQWWRLLTCSVLHAGGLHIAANMFSLWSVGRVTERLLGSARFLIVYWAAALASSVLGMATSEGTLVGASGAIVGLIGPLVVFTVRVARGSRTQRLLQLARQWAPTALMLALPGILIPQVSNAAHVGGLLAGVVVGAALGTRPAPWLPESRALRPLATAVSAIAAVALCVGIGRAMVPRSRLTLGGVRIDAPAGIHLYPLDGDTATYGAGFIAVRSRPRPATALSGTDAARWIAQALSDDLGAPVDPLRVLPIVRREASPHGPALRASLTLPGEQGGLVEFWAIAGPTRVVLLEVLAPRGAALPAGGSDAVAAGLAVP